MAVALFFFNLFFSFSPQPARVRPQAALPVRRPAAAVFSHLKSQRVSLRRHALPRLPKRLPTYTVTATVYQAVPGQTDAEPFVTADNSRIKPHYGSRQRWIALSRDLLRPWGGKFNFGDRVRLSGISPKLDGVYTVHDTMNRRHRHWVDVLVHPTEKFEGYWRNIKLQAVATPNPAAGALAAR